MAINQHNTSRIVVELCYSYYVQSVHLSPSPSLSYSVSLSPSRRRTRLIHMYLSVNGTPPLLKRKWNYKIALPYAQFVRSTVTLFLSACLSLQIMCKCTLFFPKTIHALGHRFSLSSTSYEPRHSPNITNRDKIRRLLRVFSSSLGGEQIWGTMV